MKVNLNIRWSWNVTFTPAEVALCTDGVGGGGGREAICTWTEKSVLLPRMQTQS
jgi:hypothetical protein